MFTFASVFGYLIGDKFAGDNFRRGKSSPGKIFVTCQKFRHFSPTNFLRIRHFSPTKFWRVLSFLPKQTLAHICHFSTTNNFLIFVGQKFRRRKFSSGKKFRRIKVSPGKIFVTCKNFRHSSPANLSPIRYLRKRGCVR